MSAPKPAVVIVEKLVGRSDLPEDVCGFAGTPTAAPCGKPATLHGLIEGTWEGDSTVVACAEHESALEYVADRTWRAEP